MKHLDDIRLLIKTLRESRTFHALVIESPPGWAKSTTVEKVLKEIGEPFQTLGAYSTPLFLYNALCANPGGLLVIDDCAGLFTDTSAMSVLKAATWASAGSGGQRRVAWNSTSERVKQAEFAFSGKLILLSNSLPSGKEIEAFLTRTLHYVISAGFQEWCNLLRQAAQDKAYFENTAIAVGVADYLTQLAEKSDFRKLSIRTLQLGYELAIASPDNWRSLFEKLLPNNNASTLVQALDRSGDSVQNQFRSFHDATGLSERTFYYYRNRIKTNAALEEDKLQIAVPSVHDEVAQSLTNEFSLPSHGGAPSDEWSESAALIYRELPEGSESSVPDTSHSEPFEDSKRIEPMRLETSLHQGTQIS